MENEAQGETTNGRKQVWVDEKVIQLLDDSHGRIETAARVGLSRNKAVEWCIRFALETLPK